MGSGVSGVGSRVSDVRVSSSCPDSLLPPDPLFVALGFTDFKGLLGFGRTPPGTITALGSTTYVFDLALVRGPQNCNFSSFR
jgi:hypothetical protein